MDAFGVIVLLGFITYIIVKVVRRQNKKDNLSRAKYLRSNYPNGFYEKFKTSYISENDSYDRLSRMASVSEYELQRIEDRIKSEREKKRREEEEKRKREDEARKAELERQRRIREEKERKERELNAKYLALKNKYPHGAATFEKRHIGSRLKEDLIFNEATLEKYEKCYNEYDFYHTWNEAHKSFTKKSRDLRDDCFNNWGCYTYDVAVSGKNDIGSSQIYTFKIWEHFCEAFCRDESLDYTVRTDVKLNYTRLNQFLTNNRYFNPPIYDKILSFVKKLSSDVLIVFGDSGLRNGTRLLNDYHFKYLRSILSQEGFDYVEIDNKAGIVGSKKQNIVIVELITSNDALKRNCKYLLDLKKDFKPCLTYIALLKEYTSDEMSSIIETDKKEEQEKAEKERKEREEKERKAIEERIKREREEKERKLREEQNRLYSLSHTSKANASEFRSYLNNNGITYLYHFTDQRNIASIISNRGLFSWKYCEEHNITIPNPGGGEESRYLDSRHNLEDYVRLSLCDDHPMAWRLKQQGANLVLLKIKVDVAWLQGTLFSDINAADNNHHHGATMADLRRIDINATKQHFVSSSDPIFKKHQAEVLVKTYIPLEYIVNINSPSLI